MEAVAGFLVLINSRSVWVMVLVMALRQLFGLIGAITGTKLDRTLGMWTQMGRCIVRIQLVFMGKLTFLALQTLISTARLMLIKVSGQEMQIFMVLGQIQLAERMPSSGGIKSLQQAGEAMQVLLRVQIGA